MSDPSPAPETPQPGGMVMRDGRVLTPGAVNAMRQGAERGRQAVRQAIDAAKQVTSEEALRTEIRQIAMQAMPAVLRNMIRIATGASKKATSTAQVAASDFVAKVATIEMQARAPGRGAGPLSEMPLSELEQSLSGTLDNVRQLLAIESTAERIAEPSEPLESESESLPAVGTAAAGAGAVEP